MTFFIVTFASYTDYTFVGNGEVETKIFATRDEAEDQAYEYRDNGLMYNHYPEEFDISGNIRTTLTIHEKNSARVNIISIAEHRLALS